MNERKVVIYVLFISLMLFGCKKNKDLDGPYIVERVVDGDTIICDIDGEKVKVRMIGINTPESVAEDESRRTANC